MLATIILYYYQKHNIIDHQVSKLYIQAQNITEKLRELHKEFDKPLIYPNIKPFDSAIYDIDKRYIFGSFKPKDILWDREFYIKNGYIYYIYPVKPYYLGASYLIISNKLDNQPIIFFQKLLGLFLFIAFLFFTLLGLFLGKLFVAPMKESIESMNRFIEDTTHELNTPISTILTNIELLETLHNCDGKDEMKRIDIASKTLSRLYEDLTYLKLNHNYHREIKDIDISNILNERIEFFSSMIDVKSLNLILDIDKSIIKIDKNDAIRLIDNILSNAIKYNKKGGDLKISLNSMEFRVYNSGVGIDDINLQRVQERFKRANRDEGGFGIGLDIIKYIIDIYGFKFSIKSKKMRYTEVLIEW
jgi:two-component system OmpR family sensor kinase